MSQRHVLQSLALFGCMMLSGCVNNSRHYFAEKPVDPNRVVFVTTTPSAERPRELRMFAAHEGSPGSAIGWDDLLNAIAWADIVFIGEQHDDAVGHAVQHAVVEDVAERWPRSALSMEMLERDEQSIVDDYADGIIDADAFRTLTHSEGWGGEKGTWAAWYQPMIDAALKGHAKTAHMKVVAANAPRRYVRLARMEGYERLRRLPKERRELFDFPGEPPVHYWQRFQDVMREAAEEAEKSAATQPATQPQSATPTTTQPAAAEGHGGEMTTERLQRGFRSQLIWDATMAASIARAKKDGAHKVVHVVGQFHCDFEGGTVHELRRRLPKANILTISMQAADPPATLQEEDRGRADVVIYTGKSPEEPPQSQPEAE